MDKMPFVERWQGGPMGVGRVAIPPHTRIGRLIYSKYRDWAFMSKVNHLFWRFWWVGK